MIAKRPALVVAPQQSFLLQDGSDRVNCCIRQEGLRNSAVGRLN
jgi:hypothetical protein